MSCYVIQLPNSLGHPGPAGPYVNINDNFVLETTFIELKLHMNDHFMHIQSLYFSYGSEIKDGCHCSTNIKPYGANILKMACSESLIHWGKKLDWNVLWVPYNSGFFLGNPRQPTLQDIDGNLT